MNKCFLTGNLTRQPELKLTPSGVKVCNFGLASNERWTDQETGEQRESVTFVECEGMEPNSGIYLSSISKRAIPILT